jgi:2-dehydropantoate 2-reductase
MASYFAARLARPGRLLVTLVGSWRAALAAVSAGGVRVDDVDGAWSAAVAAAPLAQAPRAELAVVLVKSHQTAAVAPAVGRIVGSAGVALTLQNGLGNREVLEAAAGGGRVLVGVTMAGVTLLGPGHVRGHVAGTVLGADEAGAAFRIAALMDEAGLKAEVEPDIDRLLWRKLAVNCAINPLSALLGVPNGALLETPDSRAVLEAAAREAGVVAAALGIDLGQDPVQAAVEVAQLTAANRSSMLQDLARGAATEIDAINGVVVREGERLGIPTPVNRRLLDDVRAREAAARRAEAAPV